MSEYRCSVCDYVSPRKEYVQKHILKKKSCGPGIKEIIEIPIEIKCEYCNKSFTTAKTLVFHIKNNCSGVKKEIKQTPDKQNQKNEFKNFSKINKLIDKYIYLIQVYPYDENIFKLGRSGDIVNRLNAYKRFKIVSITSCEDEIRCEKDLLTIFREEFEEYKDMGNEYFKGDGKVMNNRIHEYYYNLS